MTCGLFPAFYQQSVVLSLFFFSNLSLTFKKYFYVENLFLQRRQNNFFQDHEKMLARVFLVEIINLSDLLRRSLERALFYLYPHLTRGADTPSTTLQRDDIKKVWVNRKQHVRGVLWISLNNEDLKTLSLLRVNIESQYGPVSSVSQLAIWPCPLLSRKCRRTAPANLK